MDLSQVLQDKIDTIVDTWVEAVVEDVKIETAQELTYQSIRNSLPFLLQAMVTILSKSQADDLQTLVNKSLVHGVLRAEQGYDSEEVAREYRLLRSVIFSTLEEELLQTSPQEMFRTFRLIDTALDEIIARCFKSYTESRLQELQLLQNQLKLTNQELTRLVRASKENLSQLAHELKTPLTSIIGYSELFLKESKNQVEIKDNAPNFSHVEKVLQNGRQLLHLLNDALEISRYDAGKMHLQIVALDVCAMIKSVEEMARPLAKAKGLIIEINCDRAPAQVYTDALRLQQILTNLLSNAIRYTEAGKISVICQTLSKETWQLSIIDTGVGISPQNKSQIFEPYFQVSQSDSAITYSSGLGLAIVSRFVKLLQGKIFVKSELDQGSTFTVQFPLFLQI